MTSPKISVIIPIHNSALYLRRCLNSVCNQTLSDIEIICIDDCSTDESAEILQEYKNLTILRFGKNQGSAAARNAALAIAKGEYLAFVDSDDEIDLNFLEKLYEKAIEKNADIVKGQAIEIAYDGKKNPVKQIGENNKFLFLAYWWTAIYRRSMLLENNINFSTQHVLGEDLLFLNRSIIAAKNLHLVNDVFYYYHRREDSGDAKILDEKKMKSGLEIHELIARNINLHLASSDFVYSVIFHHLILCCFYLSLKSADKNLKQLCAQAAINIFKQCQNKEALELSFAKTTPQLFLFMKNNDNASLEEVLFKCKTRMELITSGLRARMQNK